MFGLRLLNNIPQKILQKAADVLVCDPSRCLRMRYDSSSCSRCATVCKAQAVDLGDGLQINRATCSGCLACSTVCPSGALAAAVSFTSLLNALADHQPNTFVLGCGKSSPPAHYRLPCFGMLSTEHLLVLAATSTCRLQLDCSSCDHCSANGMLPLLKETLQRVIELQPPQQPIELIDSPERLDHDAHRMDRRGFFASFRSLATQGAQAMLTSYEPDQQQHAYGDKVLPRRRQLYLDVKDRLTSAAATACYYHLTFSNACTACLACVRVCPTGALLKQPTSDETPTPPLFNANYCTGCGLCVDFCLDNALSISNS